MTKQQAHDAAGRLAQIRDRLKELVAEAAELVRPFPAAYSRARHYWIPFLCTAIDDDAAGPFVGRATVTLQDSIDELLKETES